MKSIGVFDSGLGGLTVLKEIVDRLPQYHYVYLGDTKRAPYGEKSPEDIYRYCCEAVDFLFQKGCELIIFACNTASAEALRKIQQEYLPMLQSPTKRVLGVIRPTVEDVPRYTHNKKVGVIATKGTVQSEAYVKELLLQDATLSVYQVACPRLVPLIEEGVVDGPVLEGVLHECLDPLQKSGVDTLILGCTHYPIVQKNIQSMLGSDVTVLSSSVFSAQKLEMYLERHPEIQDMLDLRGGVDLFVTGDRDKFLSAGTSIFPMTSDMVASVVLS